MPIELSWPDNALSPNSRVHWSKRARATALARKEAYYATKAARIGICAGDVPVTLSMTFHPPDNRRRDLDNCISSTKAHRDGIADAIGIDDRVFRISAEMGECRTMGCVVVSILS